MTNFFRVAVTQYQPQQFTNWQAYEDWYALLFKKALQQEANLLLLPEYAGLEFTALFPSMSKSQQFHALQKILPDYLSMCQKLAKDHGIYFQPGTIPVITAEGEFFNRAHFFTSSGQYDYQDKINLTAFERTSGLVKSGNTLKIFDTPLIKMAVAICYDSEFPALVHQLVLAGAELILVPSCTDSVAGFHRVHLSCRARALENQCFVANACLVGEASWCEFIDSNVGKAGIFSPVDVGFPEDGVLIQGERNSLEMLVTGISRRKLDHVRKQGAVRNYLDTQNYQLMPIVKSAL